MEVVTGTVKTMFYMELLLVYFQLFNKMIFHTIWGKTADPYLYGCLLGLQTAFEIDHVVCWVATQRNVKLAMHNTQAN